MRCELETKKPIGGNETSKRGPLEHIKLETNEHNALNAGQRYKLTVMQLEIRFCPHLSRKRQTDIRST